MDIGVTNSPGRPPSQLCFFFRQLTQAFFLVPAEEAGDADTEGERNEEPNDINRSANGVNEQRMLREIH